jgi:hypothetical protein
LKKKSRISPSADYLTSPAASEGWRALTPNLKGLQLLSSSLPIRSSLLHQAASLARLLRLLWGRPKGDTVGDVAAVCGGEELEALRRDWRAFLDSVDVGVDSADSCGISRFDLEGSRSKGVRMSEFKEVVEDGLREPH